MTEAERFETHLTVEHATGRPVELLHEATGLAKQSIKSTMTKGAVWLTRGSKTQRLRRAKRQLQVGDQLHLYFDPKVLAEQPTAPELVADQGDYSVWNKPYGIRSQGSKWGDHCTVVRWAERELKPERNAFTVHRLDRAANGLILIAHRKSMAAKLSRLFAERKIAKRYLARVEGDFAAQPNPLKVAAQLDGKDAVSEVRFCRTIGDHSIVEVKIETGRKHQIRRHLADLGYAVVGDRLYGKAKASDVDLQLTAYRLSFDCPLLGHSVEYRLPEPF